MSPISEYRALARRFRLGETLADSERERLHALALVFRNYLLAEQTS